MWALNTDCAIKSETSRTTQAAKRDIAINTPERTKLKEIIDLNYSETNSVGLHNCTGKIQRHIAINAQQASSFNTDSAVGLTGYTAGY